ncbi:MAG TPA: DUF983 domain-containing protein [Terriglobales bacterium]|nr:DUF983 domain-containing protein [Terriglobales bacterium]
MPAARAERLTGFQAIRRGLCPRYRQGPIFRGSFYFRFPKMHERCPVCALKYEREQGYFLGAMYFSYALGIVILAAFMALFWWLTGWKLEWLLLAAFVLFLPFVPFVTLFSRVLWIHFDRGVDPEDIG